MTSLLFLVLMCGCSQIAVLDRTDSQWVAEQFELFVEAEIDPLDYGDPVSGDREIGGQGFFVWNDDGTQFWRVVLVLDGRVVVLEEGAETRTFAVDLLVQGAVYSPSGNFVALRTAGESTREWTHVILDTRSGETRPLTTVGLILLSDAGSAVAVVKSGAPQEPSIQFYDANLSELVSVPQTDRTIYHPSLSADGSLFTLTTSDGDAGYLSAYLPTGALAWEFGLSRLGAGQSDVIPSSDGQLVLVSSRDWSGILDGATGAPIWGSQHEPLSFLPRALSPSGSWWVARTQGGLVEAGTALNSAVRMEISLTDSNWRIGNPVGVSDTGNVLCLHWGRGDDAQRLSLVDGNGVVRWFSSAIRTNSPERRLGFVEVNDNVESRLGAPPRVLSADGTRVIWSDLRSIYVVRMAERGA